MIRPTLSLLLLLLALVPRPTASQTPAPIAPEDYGKWESLGGAQLSPDGRWLAHALNRVDERNELRLTGGPDDGTRTFAYGSQPAFTPNSRWFAYLVGPSAEERERLEAAREPVRSRAELLDLTSGTTRSFQEVQSFRFSADGRFLMLRGYAAEDRRGSSLVVHDLAAGTDVGFGNVAEQAWSDAGALLAMAIEVDRGTGNGVQLYDAASGTLRVLDAAPEASYRGLSWREDAYDLAALRTASDSGFADTTHVVLAWNGLGSRDPARRQLDPAVTPGVPQGMRISETAALSWSEDGSALYLGLRPRRSADAPEEDRGEAEGGEEGEDEVGPSDVQVWHGADLRIIPTQRSQEQQDRRRTLLAVWHLDDARVVQIGTDLLETARILGDGRWATETDRKPYAFGAMFGRGSTDVWRVDTRTGDREKVLEDVAHYEGASPAGDRLVWFDEGAWWTVEIEGGRRTNLSASVQADFRDVEYDYPVDELPPQGMAGWTADGRGVVVHDRYDVWVLATDGSGGRRLTDGAEGRVVHRYAGVGDDERGIDLSRPFLVSLSGERTKESGWARVRAGSAPEVLRYEDARLGRLTRADSADVYAFTAERFDDSPDWFLAGPELADARQVTTTNAFQDDYAWGRAELVDFRSAAGLDLQGVLLYPAGYEPGRRYPMIVYTYERLSQNLHAYVVPSERSYYNFNVFTADGYFVLMPDIVYRGRDPGISALEAVEPAVQAVVDRGLVDPARVGLVGHSWGGYQATFLPTRTDIFAASVAGAPITNFLSFAGAIHWNGGSPEFSHWETGQARMGVPPWEDFDAYLRNSPIHQVHELRTPMLMMFGDADGTVDWHQGVEFYNFARRAGRDDFVMLVYPGEDHSLRERENQVDYHRRILEWFGHYLKDDPAPEWITRGMTWLERADLLGEGR